MRIGIDVRLLDTHRPGVNRYVINILQAMARIDRENEYLCLVGRQLRHDLPMAANFSQVLSQGPSSPTLGTLLDFPAWGRSPGIDIHHSLIPLTPFRLPCPSVVTLHDFQPVLVQRLRKSHPEFASRRSYPHQKAIDLFYRFTYRQALSRAGKIICISQHTAKQLRELMPGAAEKAQVIHYGLEKKFRPIVDKDILRRVREKYSLPDRFLFYAGTNRPNKNLPRLLEAIKSLIGPPGQRGDDLKLIVAGFEHPAYPTAGELSQALGIADRIRHIGEVSHDELPVLYSLAETVILVSILEGFGFPPLEAMACGTPVLVARDSSLPEVVGDAGLLVDPLDSQEIAGAIFRLWTDPELRREYSRRGRERSFFFDWDRAGRETIDLYRRLQAGGTMPV